MKNTIWAGDSLKIEVFGSSHKEYIGCILSGFVKGIKIDFKLIDEIIKKRAPAGYSGSGRAEDDEYKIISGIRHGITDGDDIKIIIKNKDKKSADYEIISCTPRPSHADYTSYIKYGVIFPGGGIFSARTTAPVTIAGVICEMYLKNLGILSGARIRRAGSIVDDEPDYADIKNELIGSLNSTDIPMLNKNKANQIREFISKLREECDSAGGRVQLLITNLPAGLGDGLFKSIEAKLSGLLYSIPAVKAVSFGLGEDFEKATASKANDEFYYDENNEIKTYSNNCGGILGGISTGMPVVINITFKPAPSISRNQRTVDLKNKQNTELIIKGRHDVFTPLRGLWAARSYACIAFCDMMLTDAQEKYDLESARLKIDKTDKELAILFNRRLNLAKQIGDIKKSLGKDITDKQREEIVIKKALTYADEENKEYMKEFMEKNIEICTKIQKPKAKQFCLLGRDISHSLSPVIHGIILKSFNICAKYTICEAEEYELCNFFSDFIYDGANITIPYKRQAAKYCDSLSAEAKHTGCVNTIKKQGRRLIGHNTDVYGFIKMLEVNKIIPTGKTSVIAGSGGAQSAVKYALYSLGTAKIFTASRSKIGEDMISYKDLDKIPNIDILINATPLGSSRHAHLCAVSDSVISKSEIIIDLNYSPAESMMIKKGKAAGKKCINGLDMLIYQAIASEEFFMDIHAQHLYKEIKNEITKHLNQEIK